MIKYKYGSTRSVWLFYKWAIKFPTLSEWKLFLLGLVANIRENNFSKNKWPELCPVLFYCPGGFFLVMKRAEECPRNIFIEMDIECWKHRGDYVIPVENKLSSFGILNGRLVAIDYGN